MQKIGISFFISMIFLFTFLSHTPATFAQEKLPVYLQDRGSGIPTSMFGTYVRPGELLVYPFIEFYMDSDAEYSPDELGYG